MSRLQGFFKDIPIVGSYSVLPPVLPRGSLVFLTSDGNLYVSNGETWNATGGDIGPLAAQVAQNTADIGVLQTDVSTLQGEVATNTLDIGTLQTQVATNTTNIQQNSNDIADLIVAQSRGFIIVDNAQIRTYTQPIPRVDVASVSPTVIYTLGIPLTLNINAVYMIQWNVLAHYQTANVYFAEGQSVVLSNGVGSLVDVFGTTTSQINSGSASFTFTVDFSTPNFRLTVTSDSAVTTTYSGYVIVTNILNISP
ncbi:hypothetical protein B1750_gp350 [Noumeavirus]|uniref:hypothetical protein n=1 Tax=Noumeavirus TaxID=1955558 RepID=UPI000982B8EA|nr:hypothetical protein B1750_gp350 [Noumeavirus]AQM73331.1 hypothetical protein NMV_350 [Noumeavirus]